MPATDDEIREKYLERAIRELNTFARRLSECTHCPRGQLMPVLGSGHPQADIFMLKHAPMASEIEEGVAFYGRSGNALMKSFKRLGIDLPRVSRDQAKVGTEVPSLKDARPAQRESDDRLGCVGHAASHWSRATRRPAPRASVCRTFSRQCLRP